MDRNDSRRFSFYVIVFWNKIAPLFLATTTFVTYIMSTNFSNILSGDSGSL